MKLKKKFIPLFCLALLSAPLTATHLNAAPRDVSHSTNAELRMEYLHKLLESRSGKRLAEHENGKTKAAVDEMLSKARAAVEAGNHQAADSLVKQAFNTFTNAVRELPEDPEEVDRFKQRYENMRLGLEKFVYAQEDNVERFAEDNDVDKEYNKSKVEQMLNSAKQDAGRGDYQTAIATLNEAQSILTSSLHGMLNNKTLVIDFDISTPEKEYYYEVRRYMGYEPLIEIAIEKRKPSQMAIETMRKMGKKADWMAEQSRNKVIEGDYPVAIRMMMDATDVLRQALRLAGIYL